ncbi:MAG: GNAT family N-acetyltransferase [Leptolyngbyaceae cyanobacterium]
MIIRTAQPVDIETLFDIRTSVRENYQSREEIAALGITQQSIADMLAIDCCAWIADINNCSVGFAIANRSDAAVFGLFVRPEYEGRGIGRVLLHIAEDWLFARGHTEIWLVTGNEPMLRAYGFYLHMGWQPAGVVAAGDYAGEMKFIKQRPQT